MKKIKYLLFTIFSLLFLVGSASASSATIGISTSTPQVIVGNQVIVYVTISSASPLGAWDYTLDYDQSIFRLVSAPDGLHNVKWVENNSTYNKTFTYVFTAIGSGTGNFAISTVSVIGFDESIMSVSKTSKAVKAITYNEYQASLSKNNNLSSLGVEGFDIEPGFSKDVLEYNVKVPEDTKEINIKAGVEDGTAKVGGIGKFEVSPGNNTFEIVVVAQNGSEKVYKLNVEVVDKDPIEVTYDDKKYTVVKIRENLVAPKYFKESTVNIKEFEIPAYYSDVMKITVIGLKNEEGKIYLFTYDDGKYEKYIELNLGSITVRPLAMKESIEEYSKDSIRLQNTDVECLQKSKKDRYKLIYAINVETSEEGLYMVDTKDNTIIKYDKDQNKDTDKKLEIVFYTACGLAGATFVSLIIIISLLVKNGKKSKLIKELKSSGIRKSVKKEEKLDIPVKDVPVPDISDEDDDKMSDTDKIKANFTPVKEENIKTALDADEDDVYDIFEDDRKKKKKKKKKGK